MITKIDCICPAYVNQRGDCTLFFAFNEVIRIDRPLNTVLEKILNKGPAKVDDDYVRRLLNSKISLPLVFNNSIFIKIKFRKPKIKNDPSYGYINLRCIKYVRKSSGSIFVRMSSGYSLEVISSYNFVVNSINNARYIYLVLKHMSDAIDDGSRRYQKRLCISNWEFIDKKLIGEFVK